MDHQTASTAQLGHSPEVANPTKPPAMPDAVRARLYRQRKKEAGLHCVKSFLPADEFAYLHALCAVHGQTISDLIARTINCAMRGEPMPLVPLSYMVSANPGSALGLVLVGK